jgi:hypothetical protein
MRGSYRFVIKYDIEVLILKMIVQSPLKLSARVMILEAVVTA